MHGLSVNDYFLMKHLDSAPKHRLPRVDLAKRLHINASTVTRMVVPMEKIGLVTRQVDERDARLAFVLLSNAGRTKLKEANFTFSKHANYAFEDRWSEEDLLALSNLLGRMVTGRVSNLTQV